MEKNELREIRKQMLPSVTTFSPWDSLSKDCIVLSHALFWVMTSFRNPPSTFPKGAPPLPVSPLLRRGEN